MELGKLIQYRRQNLALSVEDLSRTTNISPHTLRQYESGRRRITPKKVVIIGEALYKTEKGMPDRDSDEAKAFYGLSKAAKLRPASPLKLAIDSDGSSLRVCPLVYPPFSGDPSRFVDAFIGKMFEMAMIRFEQPHFAKAFLESKKFDISKRISWLETNEADLIVNLLSLSRMKRLRYLLTPIRVSLNAVVPANPVAVGVTKDDWPTIEEIKSFLATGKRPEKPIELLAIKNEVGWVHLIHTLKVHPEEINDLGTLDAARLASEMGRSSQHCPILVCDEVTALACVRKMRVEDSGEMISRGTLVLQPTTDEAVFESKKRCHLPEHPLAIGLRRERNDDLMSYLSDAMSMFLSCETETIAAMYEALYRELVHEVKLSLSVQDDLYMGGVRRVQFDEQKGSREILVDQNARAYARRCLQVSRSSLEHLPPELRQWESVLRRARERIQHEQAVDRNRIRKVVIFALELVTGFPPTGGNDVPAVRLADLRGKKRGTALKYVLERELDIEVDIEYIDSFLKQNEKETGEPLDADVVLEELISDMQELMEASGQTGSVTYIAKRSDRDSANDTIKIEEDFEDLKKAYEADVKAEAQKRSIPDSLRTLREDLPKESTFIAYNLGEPVGVLMTSVVDAVVEDGTVVAPKSLQADRIFVKKYIRGGGGMSRRLIRKAIEYANAHECESVWLDTSRALTPEHVPPVFRRCGFADSADSKLLYRLSRLKPEATRPSVPAPTQ
jgi:transcriptional regulator with XRE-family HTH domain